MTTLLPKTSGKGIRRTHVTFGCTQYAFGLSSPDLKNLDFGEILPDAMGRGKGLATFNPGFGASWIDEDVESRKAALRAWFKIPDDIDIVGEY